MKQVYFFSAEAHHENDKSDRQNICGTFGFEGTEEDKVNLVGDITKMLEEKLSNFEVKPSNPMDFKKGSKISLKESVFMSFNSKFKSS